MTNIKHNFQLNAFQIKIIALITMTLDHFSKYQTFTVNRTFNDVLGIVGRIAAPLFLFVVVEGLRHTRSKPKYIFRLYIAGGIIGISNRIVEKISGTGVLFDNTLPMLFYTSLFAFCIEQIIKNRSNIKLVCLASCGLIAPFLFYILNVILQEKGFDAIWRIIEIFFPSPLSISYSILFVIMGVAWYFINNKVINCMVFGLLSVACKLIPASIFFTVPTVWLSPVFISTFGLFVNDQWCMCLAIPFILLYNGEKGHSLKYMFYIYYPLHVYVLFEVEGVSMHSNELLF